MDRKMNSIEIMRILRKRKILFSALIVSGILILILFFIFKYPQKAASVRIYSEDFGEVFKMVQGDSEFLTMDLFGRLIKPVIEINKKEGSKYQIQVIDTFVNRNVNNSVRRMHDLIISRTFKKREDHFREKFGDDLEDFFTKLEKELFSWFLYKLNIRKINIENQMFDLEESIDVGNKKIKVVKQFLDINAEKYLNVLDKNSYFLPPVQQYYGLVIARDNKIINLDLLKKEMIELKSILKLTKTKKIKLFSALLGTDELKTFPMVHNAVAAFSDKLKALKENFRRSSFSHGNPVLVLYLMICIFIFLIICSFMVVYTIEWWKKH